MQLKSRTACFSCGSSELLNKPSPPYRHRVLQWVFNFSLTQENIPTTHPPQHSLKGWNPLTVDHTSHKSLHRGRDSNKKLKLKKTPTNMYWNI